METRRRSCRTLRRLPLRYKEESDTIRPTRSRSRSVQRSPQKRPSIQSQTKSTGSSKRFSRIRLLGSAGKKPVSRKDTTDSSSSSEEEPLRDGKKDDQVDSKKTSTPRISQTPYELRQKIKSRLARMADENCSSDSDDSDSEEDDDENEDVEGERAKKDNNPPARLTSVTSKSSSSQNEALMKLQFSTQRRAEEYFRAQDTRTHTSAHTMSRVEMPQFDRKTIHDILKKASNSHTSHISCVMEKHRKNFPKWVFQLREGFNLLLYGLGSKIKLLQEFREMVLNEYAVLVVNGLFPSITIKQILNSITSDILEHSGEFQKSEEHVKFIHSKLNESDMEVLIIVNSIDGTMLRQESVQNILCNLAKGEHVHVIATIDHVNAALLWDQSKLCGFNWLWHDVTTFLPYLEEMSYENSFFAQQTGSLKLSSLMHVFASLTPNAKGIFILLARHQLEQKESSSAYIGMPFQDCYQQCRESFLVNTEMTLKAQLTEFKDHKLLKVKKGPDGGDHLLIPLDSAALSEFLQHENAS